MIDFLKDLTSTYKDIHEIIDIKNISQSLFIVKDKLDNTYLIHTSKNRSELEYFALILKKLNKKNTVSQKIVPVSKNNIMKLGRDYTLLTKVNFKKNISNPKSLSQLKFIVNIYEEVESLSGIFFENKKLTIPHEIDNISNDIATTVDELANKKKVVIDRKNKLEINIDILYLLEQHVNQYCKIVQKNNLERISFNYVSENIFLNDSDQVELILTSPIVLSDPLLDFSKIIAKKILNGDKVNLDKIISAIVEEFDESLVKYFNILLDAYIVNLFHKKINADNASANVEHVAEHLYKSKIILF